MGISVLEDNTAREHVAQKPMPWTDAGSMAPCARAPFTQNEMHAHMSVVDCSCVVLDVCVKEILGYLVEG